MIVVAQTELVPKSKEPFIKRVRRWDFTQS